GGPWREAERRSEGRAELGRRRRRREEQTEPTQDKQSRKPIHDGTVGWNRALASGSRLSVIRCHDPTLTQLSLLGRRWQLSGGHEFLPGVPRLRRIRRGPVGLVFDRLALWHQPDEMPRREVADTGLLVRQVVDQHL